MGQTHVDKFINSIHHSKLFKLALVVNNNPDFDYWRKKYSHLNWEKILKISEFDSRTTLNRNTHKYGYSTLKFIEAIIVASIKDDLENTELKIDTIAYDHGLLPSQISKLFKRFEPISLIKYRKNHIDSQQQNTDSQNYSTI